MVEALAQRGVKEEDLHYDFNTAFQQLYEQAVFTPFALKEATATRDRLIDRFRELAVRVAAQLITQLQQPQDSWPIQPKQKAGYAGGLKFVVGHLFCKFAIDDRE